MQNTSLEESFDTSCTNDDLLESEEIGVRKWINQTRQISGIEYCFHSEHVDVIYSNCFCPLGQYYKTVGWTRLEIQTAKTSKIWYSQFQIVEVRPKTAKAEF